MNNIFDNRITQNGKTRVPVWFMRQAGRYHDHYQNLKKTHTFMDLCKTPELANEVTLGPINEFDFDAAILFSDLLFPLEELGTGLVYNPGPKLDIKISKLEDLSRLKQNDFDPHYYSFQKDACSLLKKSLPATKTLLGFVGAPFTLYAYAVEGSHAGSLVSSKTGLYDGRFDKFCELLLPNVLKEMKSQIEGGADAMCIFDTAVGELTLKDFKKMLPKLNWLTAEIKKVYPHTPLIYYSRNTHAHYFSELHSSNIDVLGVDWRCDLAATIKEFGSDFYIQGNFDPCWLHLSWDQLETHLSDFYEDLLKANVDQARWIMGLGHGVLQFTPQDNVKKAIEYIHKNFVYTK